MMHFSKNLKIAIVFILVIILSRIACFAEEGMKMGELKIGKPPEAAIVLPEEIVIIEDALAEINALLNSDIFKKLTDPKFFPRMCTWFGDMKMVLQKTKEHIQNIKTNLLKDQVIAAYASLDSALKKLKRLPSVFTMENLKEQSELEGADEEWPEIEKLKGEINALREEMEKIYSKKLKKIQEILKRKIPKEIVITEDALAEIDALLESDILKKLTDPEFLPEMCTWFGEVKAQLQKVRGYIYGIKTNLLKNQVIAAYASLDSALRFHISPRAFTMDNLKELSELHGAEKEEWSKIKELGKEINAWSKELEKIYSKKLKKIQEIWHFTDYGAEDRDRI